MVVRWPSAVDCNPLLSFAHALIVLIQLGCIVAWEELPCCWEAGNRPAVWSWVDHVMQGPGTVQRFMSEIHRWISAFIIMTSSCSGRLLTSVRSTHYIASLLCDASFSPIWPSSIAQSQHWVGLFLCVIHWQTVSIPGSLGTSLLFSWSQLLWCGTSTYHSKLWGLSL